MLVPLNTDAPVYHFPYATIGLIAVSVVAFLATGLGEPDVLYQYQLSYGDGLHPVQWLTSNFLHSGIMHLLGNMVFLWGFGLVVEGKLGWQRFLAVFFTIAIVECAIEQTMMLGYSNESQVAELLDQVDPEHIQGVAQLVGVDPNDPEVLKEIGAMLPPPGSLGASSVVYGLLAISLVWAPKNEVQVFFLLFYRGIIFDISILAFAGWYIGIDIALTILSGFQVATELLHSLGAVVGFAIGVVMLKRGWVDCENWDLFSVLSGNYGQWARDEKGNLREETKPLSAEEEAAFQRAQQKKKRRSVSRDSDRHERLKRVTDAISVNDFEAAATEYRTLKQRHLLAHLERPDYQKLIEGMLKNEQLLELMPLVDEYTELFPEHKRMRLLQAQLVLRIDGDHRRVRQLLKDFDPKTMAKSDRAIWQELARRVQGK